MAAQHGVCKLWELPEVLLFHVVSYLARPTKRVRVVCRQLAPLCKASRTSLVQNEASPLWSAILKCDYGAQLNERSGKRTSKRLKQTHLQRVRDAHKMAFDNTEIAYHYLTELCVRGLTRRRLESLIEEYGAHNRINRLTTTGGTFLVECCRARDVKESTIRKCVELLVENYGAAVNVAASEQNNSTATNGRVLTPLCVAAARGMPTVVQYLLQKGADPTIASTGRFRLFKQPRKSVHCKGATPLCFARTISVEEKKYGASPSDLKDLKKVTQLLTRAETAVKTKAEISYAQIASAKVLT